MNAEPLPSPVRAYVAFGANLGDAAAAFAFARERLDALPHTQVQRASSLYRSAPVGVTGDQPDYLNAVLALDTALPPQPLLQALHNIEDQGGRTRTGFRAPRTLDLDLLLHGATVATGADLHLPHPRMHERAFVLVPLAEISADLTDLVIPGHGPLSVLLDHVAGQAITRL